MFETDGVRASIVILIVLPPRQRKSPAERGYCRCLMCGASIAGFARSRYSPARPEVSRPGQFQAEGKDFEGLVGASSGRSEELKAAVHAGELHGPRHIGQPLDWVHSGSLKVARRPQDAEVIKSDFERGRRMGLDVELISPDQASHLNPFLKPKGVVGAMRIGDDRGGVPVGGGRHEARSRGGRGEGST